MNGVWSTISTKINFKATHVLISLTCTFLTLTRKYFNTFTIYSPCCKCLYIWRWLPIPPVIPITKSKLDFYHFANFANTAGINYTLKQTSLRTQILQQQIRTGTETNLQKKYWKLFMPQKPWQKKSWQLTIINWSGGKINQFHKD